MLIVIIIMLRISICIFNRIASLIFSLNTKSRKYEQVQHENQVQRLKKRISEIRATYPIQEYRQDYGKTLEFKKRISRFPSNNK